MRRPTILVALAIIVLALAGCQCPCVRQNDNLTHALYDCRSHQDLIRCNDTHDVHALADKAWVHEWCRAMDGPLGAGGYDSLHQWLNPPCAE